MGALSNAIKEIAGAQKIYTTEIKVPGGATFTVGAKDLNANDFAYVNRKLKMQFQENPTDFKGQVEMLIRKAHLVSGEGDEVEMGDAAFDATDRPVLMSLPVLTIAGWFRDLFEEGLSSMDEGAQEDTAKN